MRALIITVSLLLSLVSVATATPQITIQDSTTILPLKFDHLLIIAMENTPYQAVMGTGAGNATNAPFIQSLLAYSATSPRYDSYGHTATVDNCSTGCYAAVTSGNYTNNWNITAGTIQRNNIFNELASAGLTWRAFCEDTCPEGTSHFPPLLYSNTYKSPGAIKTYPSCGYQNSWKANYSQLIRELNSTDPANLVWFTPTDCHNMHGGPSTECVNNSISCTNSSACIKAGDNYLKQLLVGTGTISNPAPGSALSTHFFNEPTLKPALLFWWDECAENSQGFRCSSGNDTPNLLCGTNINTHVNHVVSTAANYDEYSVLHMIEKDWGLSCQIYDCKAPSMDDFLR